MPVDQVDHRRRHPVEEQDRALLSSLLGDDAHGDLDGPQGIGVGDGKHVALEVDVPLGERDAQEVREGGHPVPACQPASAEVRQRLRADVAAAPPIAGSWVATSTLSAVSMKSASATHAGVLCCASTVFTRRSATRIPAYRWLARHGGSQRRFRRAAARVTAVATVGRVLPAPTAQVVVPGAARQRVPSAATADDVIARAAADQVRPTATDDGVVASSSHDDVDSVGPGQHVRVGRADDRGRAAEAGGYVHARGSGIQQPLQGERDQEARDDRQQCGEQLRARRKDLEHGDLPEESAGGGAGRKHAAVRSSRDRGSVAGFLTSACSPRTRVPTGWFSAIPARADCAT